MPSRRPVFLLRRVLRTAVIALALSYLALLLVSRFGVNALLFHPPRPPTYTADPPYQLLEREGDDLLAVRYIPNSNARFTILYSHGNAEDLGHLDPVLPWYVREGFGVLAYDYSGYGRSTGHPSEQGTYRDIERAYRFLTEEQGVAPGRILVLGKSVGSGPATELARRKPVGGLILESAFTSVYRVATPVRFLPGDRYENLSKLGEVDCPVLVIHGKQDEVIPFAHGEALYRAAEPPKRRLWVERGHHNDLMFAAGPDYWRALREFSHALEAGSD